MKREINLAISLVLLLGLVACSKENPSETIPDEFTTIPQVEEYVFNDDKLKNTTTVDDNNRVFYEIFTGSFSDSNNDGIGDLRGIINRLDYLNDGNPNSGKSLGIGGIWLTPIFQSPSYHKYDVTNYYKIDTDFGKMDDLKELIKECHKRDIKLILDLPINHTSTANDMFLKFKEAHNTNDVYNPYYHFYSHYNEGGKAPLGRKFTKLGGTKLYYESNFSSEMPELNFDIDGVRAEFLKIAKYYLDMGIDGFRFDAAKYVYYGEEDRNSEFWTWYMDELKAIKSDIYTVGEVWDSDIITNNYFDSNLGCFNFTMSGPNGQIASTAKEGNVNLFTSYTEKYLKRINQNKSGMMQYPFISNHDMDRTAGFLPIDTKDAYIAANLLLLAPGSPFIYYGDEIGMKGTRGGSNTDANRRLAMLWGDDDTVKDPIGSTYNRDRQINGTVKEHIIKSDSLYNHYKKLILLRNANPEIARGEYLALKSKIKTLGGFISTYNNDSVMVLHNTSDKEVSINIKDLTNINYTEIRGYVGANDAKLNNGRLTISGKTSVVIK